MDSKKEIKRVTERIVRKYRPKKIILYGSFAYGEPHKESDVDLLIIKSTRKPRTKRHLEVDRMLLDRHLPLDILVYTPLEIKKRLLLGDFFIKNILEQGKILYAEK